MKIEKLEIHNFLTIGDAEIELDDRGLLLIQGENADDPSAESNGAGKSSVVDALCWALFGVTARDVKGDDVVNDTRKKDCVVAVRFSDGADVYSISRHRKHSIHKNQVFIGKHDVMAGGLKLIDMSKGTDKETQAVIDGIIGCSLDVFMAAVYAGQERMPDLPGMTDKFLKALIEEAAGVEVLTAAYTVARDKYAKQKANVDALTVTQTTAVNNAATLAADLASLDAQNAAFESGRRQRAKDELAKVPPINAEIAKAESALTTWDEPASRAELADCEAKLSSHKAVESEFNRLNTEAALLDKQLAAARSTISLKKSSIQNAEDGLARIESQIGKPCGECGKTYCEHDMEAAREARRETIAALKKDLLEFATETKKLAEKVAAAQDAAAKFKASMPDVTAVAKRQLELSNLLNAIDATKRKIEGLKKDAGTHKANASAKLTETNPWTKAIESKKDEIARNQTVLDGITERIAKAGEDLELLADAVKVYGPAGVRAHILDTVTPYLNEQTREYLGSLADGNIHATWATLTKTAKGELKEKFNIDVVNDKGAKSFAGLSGGEKRKVRLATAMALQDLVASRATKPIDIFIADEVDHALDESGLERLMGVLERKAKERGTVLVISHNSLADWCDNVITVTKKGGVAGVSGATERGL